MLQVGFTFEDPTAKTCMRDDFKDLIMLYFRRGETVDHIEI